MFRNSVSGGIESQQEGEEGMVEEGARERGRGAVLLALRKVVAVTRRQMVPLALVQATSSGAREGAWR